MRLDLRGVGSFYEGRGNGLADGDVQGALASADVVVEGELKARFSNLGLGLTITNWSTTDGCASRISPFVPTCFLATDACYGRGLT